MPVAPLIRSMAAASTWVPSYRGVPLNQQLSLQQEQGAPAGRQGLTAILELYDPGRRWARNSLGLRPGQLKPTGLTPRCGLISMLLLKHPWLEILTFVNNLAASMAWHAHKATLAIALWTTICADLHRSAIQLDTNSMPTCMCICVSGQSFCWDLLYCMIKQQRSRNDAGNM